MMEMLDYRIYLTVRFTSHEIVSADVVNPFLAMATDMDGDADVDFLFTNGGIVAWYENSDGQFSTTHMIDRDKRGYPDRFHRHDLNNDGHLDLQVSRSSETILFESVGNGPRFEVRKIRDIVDLAFVDLDGDGDMDAHGLRPDPISLNEGSLVLFTNDNGILRESDVRNYRGNISRAHGDLDRDGDYDLLVFVDGSVRQLPNDEWEIEEPWSLWLNNQGVGQFSEHVLTRQEEHWRFQFDAMRLVDLNGDDLLDIVDISGANSWFENRGDFEFRHRVQESEGSIESMHIVDLDEDGDVDMVGGTLTNLFWHQNDGNGNFTFTEIASDTGLVSSVSTTDFDQDGDLDIFVAMPDAAQIGWYENVGGAQAFDRHLLTSSGTSRGSLAAISDKDGDGDLDLLVSLSKLGQLQWYENDGSAALFQRREAEFYPVLHAWMIDVDGDGTKDFVAPDEYTHHDVADINGDGLDDIVRIVSTGSWHFGALVWYENLPRFGEGVFGPPIDAGFAMSSSRFDIGDIDGDGDLDAISGHFEGILVYRNVDGAGTFDTVLIENRFGGHAGNSQQIEFADFDNDGDLDFATGTYQLAFYDNDGSGEFTERVVFPLDGTLHAIAIGDINNDGLLDSVVSFWSDTGGNLVWLENTGDSFAPHNLATSAEVANKLFVQDLDGDGDLDVITSSTQDASLRWYESDLFVRDRVLGDIDNNGALELADFDVLARNFQRDQATYEDGDFDRDGKVTFADFLIFAHEWSKRHDVTQGAHPRGDVV